MSYFKTLHMDTVCALVLEQLLKENIVCHPIKEIIFEMCVGYFPVAHHLPMACTLVCFFSL